MNNITVMLHEYIFLDIQSKDWTGESHEGFRQNEEIFT
jgi:hypothetical protein